MLQIIKKNNLLIYAGLIILSIISLGPLLFILLGMTQDSSFIFNTINKLFFGNYFKDNYEILKENFDILRVFLNSLFIALINASVGVTIMFLAAYAFAIYEFKGKKTLFLICLIALMIPGNVIIINKFRVISLLNMKNSYIGLILPTIINIHVLLLLIRNIEFLNKDILESARIDGASELRIMIKLGVPAVFSYIIIGFFNMFVYSWNNFLLPLLIVNTEDYFTLPIMISSLADPMRFKFGTVFVATFITIIPVLFLLLLFSRFLFKKIN